MQIASAQHHDTGSSNEREAAHVVHCLSTRDRLNVHNQDRIEGIGMSATLGAVRLDRFYGRSALSCHSRYQGVLSSAQMA